LSIQPSLAELGWDAVRQSELEQLEKPDLIPGRITAQHRGAYVVRTERGELRAEATGRLLYGLAVGDAVPAVGDWVAVRSRAAEDRATIHAVLTRTSAFARKQAGRNSVDHVLAANVDVAFLLSGLDADFSLRRLERYLTTAWESGAEPVVVLTKADLSPDVPASVLAAESVAIGVPVHAVSNLTGEGLDGLAPYLRPGRTVVLLGSSGAGKSTLLNRLAGSELMVTNDLAADGTGRHTTTHRELFHLRSGALVIDTPGLRELQLWEGDVEAAFTDIDALAAGCRFRDCAHLREPGCAVLGAVEEGSLELERLRSWRTFQRELAAIAARTDKRLSAERKRRWRQQERAQRAR
jgi:ribosome biogenesis GTPase / thiamine phosphate phosphatase